MSSLRQLKLKLRAVLSRVGSQTKVLNLSDMGRYVNPRRSSKVQVSHALFQPQLGELAGLGEDGCFLAAAVLP